jgi:hypothetical protein
MTWRHSIAKHQPAKTKRSAPQITEFHINGAVSLKPMSQADSSSHAPNAKTAATAQGLLGMPLIARVVSSTTARPTTTD